MTDSPRLFCSPARISSHLHCVVCQEPFRDPTRLQCGHVFCKSCIEIWVRQKGAQATCPTCRSKVTRRSLQPDVLVKKLVGEIAVSCPHCRTRVPLEDLPAHKTRCVRNPANVPKWVTSAGDPLAEDEDAGGVSSLRQRLWERCMVGEETKATVEGFFEEEEEAGRPEEQQLLSDAQLARELQEQEEQAAAAPGTGGGGARRRRTSRRRRQRGLGRRAARQEEVMDLT